MRSGCSVSVLFAAGDELATGGLTDGKAHVWFPASSPYALGCGGTSPTLGADGRERRRGNGLERRQRSAPAAASATAFRCRTINSVCALPPSVNDGASAAASPMWRLLPPARPGYRIVFNGAEVVKDGTSAAAPLWAGLIAIANAQRGTPLGFLNSALYANPSWFRAITTRATTGSAARAMTRGRAGMPAPDWACRTAPTSSPRSPPCRWREGISCRDLISHTNKNPAICGGVQSGGASLPARSKPVNQAGMRSSCSCGSRST